MTSAKNALRMPATGRLRTRLKLCMAARVTQLVTWLVVWLTNPTHSLVPLLRTTWPEKGSLLVTREWSMCMTLLNVPPMPFALCVRPYRPNAARTLLTMLLSIVLVMVLPLLKQRQNSECATLILSVTLEMATPEKFPLRYIPCVVRMTVLCWVLLWAGCPLLRTLSTGILRS